MPTVHPITASGLRDVEKTPRPVPKAVRDAIVLMVYGKPGDPDGRPVDFIEAGKACGIKPDIMRRWLDRPAVRALLHAERRAFRAAICAGNELSLARVRDRSENGMAVIGAVRTLENIAEEAEVRPRGQHQEAPGLCIVIQHRGDDVKVVPTIDITPGTDDAVDPTR